MCLTGEELGEEVQECILKCLDCQRECLRLVDHYRRLDGARAYPERREGSECPDTRLLLNCSEICATTARFMFRGSEFCPQLCLLCADVCKSLARSCDKVLDDAEIQVCVATCQRCAECCARVAVLGSRTPSEGWPG